ncbi:MAG: bifunctional (p)ppGpp synthetase/guanosine-3',5'-bis(diphosphate) 3'-pyrophosphohydrolase, partial [Clostridia bacterium]|nr:bifunctional (p)ppGpp synthetase/guanosine-3',5'-bis(diphosphate) 3'-pyrophosphohydrolase [Clostridia bacterium]
MNELKQKVLDIYGEKDYNLFLKAYEFAKEAHKDQKRMSGEPYFIHPYEVSNIVISLGLDIDTVCAALLHDVVEDTDVTLEEIEKEFNPSIANLVDGVTKLSRIGNVSKEQQAAESIRKMFLAMAKDIRVIFIKLADRLHNMRTLEYGDREKQIRKATETIEIYAPLAHRLGIYKIKGELEDLCFRYLYPEDYFELKRVVEENSEERKAFLRDTIQQLSKKIEEHDIKCEINGRDKSLYSIYKKMKANNSTFDQIYDITAIRVIVNTISDCYSVLGIIHDSWMPIPGRFKDYIAMPKPNMYQSLHTTLIGSKGRAFEVQIRTFQMHRTAEYGISAHWKYKEGRETDDLDAKLSWLRSLMEWQTDLRDANEFMQTLKVDFFSDVDFVFTPKGDVRDLVKGSTPLDFAYAIHSQIGNKCVGAKVNNRIVPLNHQLGSGDIVEILTSNSSKGPSPDWLSIVKTNQARSKI